MLSPATISTGLLAATGDSRSNRTSRDAGPTILLPMGNFRPLPTLVRVLGPCRAHLSSFTSYFSAGAFMMSYTAPVFPSTPDQDQEFSMSNKTGDAVSDLSTDLAAVRADIARLSDTMATLMRSQADAAGAAVRGAVDGARDQLSQAAAQAQDSAFGAAADLERRIERNPLTAVLIAAGIGMALGMMSKSRG